MSNNKQSSVEWVIENLTLIHALLSRREIGVEFFNRRYNEIVEQGKAMHKEETIKLYNDYEDYLDDEFKNQLGGQSVIKSFEQYYNETFGGNNEQH